MAKKNTRKIIAELENKKSERIGNRSAESTALTKIVRIGWRRAEDRIAKYEKMQEFKDQLSDKGVNYRDDEYLNPELTPDEILFYQFLNEIGVFQGDQDSIWPPDIFGYDSGIDFRELPRKYQAALTAGGHSHRIDEEIRPAKTEKPTKISGFTKFLRIYFVVGLIALTIAYSNLPSFAFDMVIFWLTLGIGMGLIVYGKDKKRTITAKFSNVLGWLLVIIVILVFVVE